VSTNLLTLIGVACAGAVGAIARYLVDGAVSDRTGGSFPWGTLVVNITAAFLLGLVFAFFQARIGVVPVWVRTTIQTGLIGTYSTFSTLTLETLNLLQAGSYLLGAANIFGSIALGMFAVYGGTALGRWV
jgi:fluoride exporter